MEMEKEMSSRAQVKFLDTGVVIYDQHGDEDNLMGRVIMHVLNTEKYYLDDPERLANAIVFALFKTGHHNLLIGSQLKEGVGMQYLIDCKNQSIILCRPCNPEAEPLKMSLQDFAS